MNEMLYIPTSVGIMTLVTVIMALIGHVVSLVMVSKNVTKACGACAKCAEAKPADKESLVHKLADKAVEAGTSHLLK